VFERLLRVQPLVWIVSKDLHQKIDTLGGDL
jgi:hypothetical protein